MFVFDKKKNVYHRLRFKVIDKNLLAFAQYIMINRMITIIIRFLLSFHRCIGDERCDREWHPVKRAHSRQGDQSESYPRELLQQSNRPAHRKETEVRFNAYL